MDSVEPDQVKLADLYPDIERLTLFVAFERADAETDPNYQQIIFSEDSVSAFFLACSREGCVDGGFDYGPFIEQMVGKGEEMAHGTIVCQGVLTGRECEHRCGLVSEYRILIQRKP